MNKLINEKSNIQILLVEDESLTQELLLKLLKRKYNKVVVAQNGVDALKIYKNYFLNNENFDIIISDINMPMMDGTELLQNIRQMDEFIPFIFLTGQTDLNNILQLIELDINDYILKPLDIKRLFGSIDNIINKKFRQDYIKKLSNYVHLNNNLYWDRDNKTIYQNNKSIKLTKKEILLLDLLFDNVNTLIKTEDIIYLLWEDSLDDESSNSNLKNLISRIRIKINTLNIENLYGMGYQLRV
ncbi:MAG: response regulator transcription factor [Arcobacter sp.]|nr:response regulator transcription factor [Arcobacter sp.]